MKKAKKIFSIIITFCILLSILQTNTLTTYATSGSDIVSYARQFLGNPYVSGGKGPYSFDCSGFVSYVFKHFGITLPTGTWEYWNNPTSYGSVIDYGSTSNAKAGDVLVWSGHVAIYTENGYCIHALNPSDGVTEKYKVSVLTNGSNYKVLRIYGIDSDNSNSSISYTSISAGTYYIKNAGTGKYLYVSGSADVNTQNVIVAEMSDASGLKMTVSAASTGYKIKPGCSSSRIINPYATTVVSGKNVNLYNDENDSTQWWRFEKVSGGYVIRNVQNPSCVLTAGSDSNVTVATYTGSSSQIWTLESVSGTTKFALDVNGWLDSSDVTNIIGYGTCDVYINGTQVANDVNDFYGEYAAGTTYSINDIKATGNNCYTGVKSGNLSGTLSSATKVVLSFNSSHTYNSGTVTKEATCNSTGVKTYTCTACSATKTETIETTDHKWVYADVIFEPSCMLEGTCYYLCEYCQQERFEQIPATGHNYVFTSHTDKSCSSYGYDTYKCSDCGVTENRNYEDPLEHDYVLVEEQAATASSNGYKEYRCSVCSWVLMETIPKLSMLMGDVNTDGKVTASDARTILRAAAHLETLNDEQFYLADMDLNSKITASDARKTLRIAALLDKKILADTYFPLYCKTYYSGDTENGPCYMFDLLSVYPDTNIATFSIAYAGYNFSPVYSTESITVTLNRLGTASFSWTDSWGNEGIGTFTVIPNNEGEIELTMTVTKEADLNRATLATDGVLTLYPE